MKRALTLLSAAALTFSLAACGAGGSTSSAGSSISNQAIVSSPSPELTEEDVLAAYDQAAKVYDWFDLYSLPASGALVTEDGQPYDPSRNGTPYQVVDYDGLNSYADLDIRVRNCFSPELADKIMGDSVNYRDIGGKLYTASGARGSNLYLLDKTVAAEQVDENHWTVTLTFYADSYELDYPAAVIGYSQKTLDYTKTASGWRFTSFCPSDALDETADTVFQFSYDFDDFLKEERDMENWSDLQLACWLLHADGAFSEGPSDTLSHRFLNDPDSWFAALSVFPGSPWKNAGMVTEFPAYDTYAWFTEEEQHQFQDILTSYQPKNDAEQALLDTLKAAQTRAVQSAEDDATGNFCFVVNDQFLSLGKKDGNYPWSYTGFPASTISAGKGDNGEQLSTFSYEGADVVFSTSPDDGRSYVFRMATDQPGVETLNGIGVGSAQEQMQRAYPAAVSYGGKFQSYEDVDFDAVYVFEPGGYAYCKHIAFFLKDGAVVSIEMEDLMDGRLLNS